MAHNDYQELISHSSQLEKQLKQSQSQLEEEREKCHLLADHPMIKPATPGSFSNYTASLSSKESQQQVTANTVRILTLEEQNNALRRRMAEQARTMTKSSDKQRTASVSWDNSHFNRSNTVLLLYRREITL